MLKKCGCAAIIGSSKSLIFAVGGQSFSSQRLIKRSLLTSGRFPLLHIRFGEESQETLLALGSIARLVGREQALEPRIIPQRFPQGRDPQGSYVESGRHRNRMFESRQSQL